MLRHTGKCASRHGGLLSSIQIVLVTTWENVQKSIEDLISQGNIYIYKEALSERHSLRIFFLAERKSWQPVGNK
jgi:hypothetical protein